MTDWICIVCNNAIFPYNHIEDNDKFVSCLSENWIVTLNLNLAELREKHSTHLSWTVENKDVRCGIAIRTFIITISSEIIHRCVIII